MKKFILGLGILLCLHANAQVQIGEATDSAIHLPISSCSEYSYSQQLFLASEINASGKITSLSFYLDDATDIQDFSNSLNWDIYLGHTTKTNFASKTDWEPTSNLAVHYSGTVDILSKDSWVKITLDTPFDYNGSDNLIVGVDENSPGRGCDMYWRYSTSTGTKAIAYTGNNHNPNPDNPIAADIPFSIRSNIIFGGITESCPRPLALTATTLSETSASFNWTENGSTPSSWDIEVVNLSTSGKRTGTPTHVTTSRPFTLTGLTPTTDYDYYVRGTCGTEKSFWNGPYRFSSDCSPYTAPYSEGFDNGGRIPTCWTTEGDSGWSFRTSGPRYVGDEGIINGSTDTNSHYAVVNDDLYLNVFSSSLISPAVDLSMLTTPTLSFYEISNNNGSPNAELTVDVWDGAAWNTVGFYNKNTRGGWEKRVIDLSGITFTGKAKVRFSVSMGLRSERDNIAIDDVSFDELPNCVEPTQLTATNFSDTSTGLGWTENGTASSWNVEVVPAGAVPTGSGTATTLGVTNPFTKTGLTPNTAYEFYVQSVCGSETSVWAGPFAFRTDCSVITAPHSEGFENGGEIPDCWSAGGDNDFRFASGHHGGGWVGERGNLRGTTATNAYYAVFDDSAPGIGSITSPVVDLSTLTTPALTFYEISYNEGHASATLTVDVWDGAAWNTMGTYNANTVNRAWELKVIDLSGLSFTGNAQARFSITNSGSGYDDIAIDDVSFTELPSCIAPNELTASPVSNTSVQLGWTANGSEAAWDIEVVEAFATPSRTPSKTVTTNPYTYTGLATNKSYDFYVRANCGGSDTSDWIGPESFRLGYCVSIPSYATFYGLSNLKIETTSFSNIGTYRDFTASVIDLAQGATANVEITFETGRTYDTNIWIDFNDDYIFQSSELLYSGESSSALSTTLNASFPMPADAVLGRHRMRIGTADTGQATPNPCFNGADGTTIDVDINIILPTNDDCSAPKSLALATEISADNNAATDSGQSASCGSGTIKDLWYSFVAPTSGDVTISTTADSYALFSDCTTEISCTVSANTGLTAGGTYYVRVAGTPASFTLQVDDTTTLATPALEDNTVFSYYPNPTENTLTLEAQAPISHVSLYNMLGQVVLVTNPNTAKSTLDISNVPAGVYFVQVTIADTLQTVKVIKQ